MASQTRYQVECFSEPGESQSDALAFFGATGDLAYKKVFPALQSMAKRGHLKLPVVGVAKANWNVEQVRARARESLETHGGASTRRHSRSSRPFFAM